MKRPFVIILLVCGSLVANAQLIISTGGNYSNNVQNLLSGCCAQTSNVYYNGATIAAGTYNELYTPLNMTEGIILTSGKAQTAIGPNNSANAGLDNGTGGNSFLTQACGFETYDAATLEFDYTPNVNGIMGFKYVFGSEEYPEFVGTQFNDVFVCLISGPDITGELNIATVPDSNLSITVNNYNIGTYPHYFVTSDTIGGFIQYDGYTFPLYAKFLAKAGMTYHFRFIIADASDAFYDSGVFIEDVANPLGINDTEITADNKFTVYPNPATNTLSIKANSLVAEKVTISLFDIAGKQVQNIYSGTVDFMHSTVTTDISALQQGMYIVRVETKDKAYNLKVVKP